MRYMQAVFASHLNAHLMGDPFLKHILPLDPGGADFFDSFKDGVLMCRIVCLAIPGSIGAPADLALVYVDWVFGFCKGFLCSCSSLPSKEPLVLPAPLSQWVASAPRGIHIHSSL